jgi:hypothetical protein
VPKNVIARLQVGNAASADRIDTLARAAEKNAATSQKAIRLPCPCARTVRTTAVKATDAAHGIARRNTAAGDSQRRE